MDEAGQGIVLSSPPKCGVPVARVGLIDRRTREVASQPYARLYDCDPRLVNGYQTRRVPTSMAHRRTGLFSSIRHSAFGILTLQSSSGSRAAPCPRVRMFVYSVETSVGRPARLLDRK